MRLATIALCLTTGACVPDLPGGSLDEPTGGAGASTGGAAAPTMLQTLVLDAGMPAHIAVDSTNVYWVSRRPPYALMKAPIAGGPPTTLSPVQSFSAWVAAGGDSVYWSDAPDGTTITEIRRMAAAGGAPTTVAKSADAIIRFAVGRDGVYWMTSAGAVMKVGLAGGTPRVLATDQNMLKDIVVDGTSVYWFRADLSAIMRLGVSGGEPVQITTSAGGAVSLAIDATYAYWAVANREVMRASLADGRPETVFPSARSTSVAVDASGVYWTDFGSVLVGRPTSATDVRAIATGGKSWCYGLVVDANSVYWIDGVGSIFRAPK